MKSTEIRQKFFDFFEKHGHTKVSSSSLIPAQDPTLLFANAGMNQFKDVFLGKEKRSYSRAVSIQKCVRAGGKHNDLDNVGFTRRHLTFFEMMGNFSFGDYFKKEAIHFAWDFLTQHMNFPKDKLHATVFKNDHEAYDIWYKEIGIPKERLHRMTEKDNFWQMGDTGPCGPCSEILIDRGEEYGVLDPENGERLLEVWNLVFMQYDRQPDGTDLPLKSKGVDTGMGFERLCSIMQNAESVYETDLFLPIIKKAEALTGIAYKGADTKTRAAFRVLADHTRSTTMLISDGCAPSNEGRGYVLRKIIRRAALFQQKLTEKTIMPELVKTFITMFSPIYPELKTHEKLILKVLSSELEKFSINLTRGKTILETYFQEAPKEKTISGMQAFKLYDTYGFPTELITLLANEQGFTVDMLGFEKEMEKQKEQSKQKECAEDIVTVKLDNLCSDFEFTGYEEHITQTKITSLIVDNNLVKSVKAGTPCWIITQKSPVYVECGGQIGDRAWFEIDDKKIDIEKLQKIDGIVAAKITPTQNLKVGEVITVVINECDRYATMRSHTATHLLQAALRQIFGEQIKQAGSFVSPDQLRFDFTYHQNLTLEEIKAVETIVNEKILENITTNIRHATLKEANKAGVIAFFGEKYNPECVRIVEIPGISAELCGGTHVAQTGDIGSFKIVEVSSLSAGHRRITAVTGMKAVELFQESYANIKQLCQDYKVQPQELYDAIDKQKSNLKNISLELKNLKKELWNYQVPTILTQIKSVKGIPFLYRVEHGIAPEELRNRILTLNRSKPGFYFIINKLADQIIFIATLDKSFQPKINLKEFATWLEKNYGLKGGGPATLLQGGGTHMPKDLQQAIEQWMMNH